MFWSIPKTKSIVSMNTEPGHELSWYCTSKIFPCCRSIWRGKKKTKQNKTVPDPELETSRKKKKPNKKRKIPQIPLLEINFLFCRICEFQPKQQRIQSLFSKNACSSSFLKGVCWELPGNGWILTCRIPWEVPHLDLAFRCRELLTQASLMTNS